MKTSIVNFFKRAFAPNGLLHSLLIAVAMGCMAALKPYFEGGTLPTQVQLIVAVKAGVIAGGLYLIKNGLLGSSVTSLNDQANKSV